MIDGNVTNIKRYKVMKTRIIITAVAALAMLMPLSMEARGANRGASRERVNHRTEMQHRNGHATRVGHHNKAMHHPKVGVHVGHRPGMGARFTHRPSHGRFVMVNHERLWLAGGVLYRVVTNGFSSIYIVVGYI